jgi:uncharacterized protein (DUF305 family)
MKVMIAAAVALITVAAPALAQHDHGPAPSAGQAPAGPSRSMDDFVQQLRQPPAGHDHAAAQSEATKAYVAAMDAMHGPMMDAVKDGDPDVAFVKGMIPHHQGAIAMAKVVLQHGKDEQVKKWASDVIREQEREINEMQDWLKRQKR